MEFRLGTSLRRVALLANLCTEIEANLRVLMDGQGGDISPRYDWATYARSELVGGLHDESSIPGKHLKWLGIFAITGCALGRNLSTTALNEAIACGVFLDFDRATDTLVVGKFQQAMLDLRKNIDRNCYNEDLLGDQERIALGARFAKFDGDGPEAVPNLSLQLIFAIHDSQFNVVALLKAIHQAANGTTTLLDDLQLLGDSPLTTENETIQREQPTPEQIKRWLE